MLISIKYCPIYYHVVYLRSLHVPYWTGKFIDEIFISIMREYLSSRRWQRRSCVTIVIVKITVQNILKLTVNNVPVAESDSENNNLAVCQKEYC